MTHNVKISSSFEARNHFVRAGVRCCNASFLETKTLKIHQELSLLGVTLVCPSKVSKGDAFKSTSMSSWSKKRKVTLLN